MKCYRILNNWKTVQGDSAYNNWNFKTQNRWYKAENNWKNFSKSQNKKEKVVRDREG